MITVFNTISDDYDICELLQIRFDPSVFSSSSQGWMYPDISILLPIFDPYLLTLVEGGILDGIVKYYKPQQPTCKKDEMSTISFKFVIIMFSILGFGVFLSIIILFVEKIAIRFYSPGNF